MEKKIKIEVKPWIRQQVECPACDAYLEFVELNPVSLDWPYDEGYLEFDYDEEGEINLS